MDNECLIESAVVYIEREQLKNSKYSYGEYYVKKRYRAQLQ